MKRINRNFTRTLGVGLVTLGSIGLALLGLAILTIPVALGVLALELERAGRWVRGARSPLLTGCRRD